MTTYNPKELIGPVGNYPLYAKKIFLTFLQAYFSTYNRIDSRFYWTSDFKTTKILIVDKKAYDTGVKEKRPAIVINRGPLGWANATIGQLADFNFVTSEPTYTDLIPVSISINCIGKNGVELEELASIIMNAITAYKVELRSEGVHQITRIAMGQETQLRNDVNDVFSVVPLDISFSLQSEIAKTAKFYPLAIKYTSSFVPETVDSTPNPYWEVPTKSWFETDRTLTMDVTLTEETDYEATMSGINYRVTDSGLLSFGVAPVTEKFVVLGEQSITGPSDGTLPKLGSSKGLDNPGFLANGAVSWEIWYTRLDTLEAATYALPADGNTTLFAVPGGIYGYGSIFNTFTLTEDVSDDVGWGTADD